LEVSKETGTGKEIWYRQFPGEVSRWTPGGHRGSKRWTGMLFQHRLLLILGPGKEWHCGLLTTLLSQMQPALARMWPQPHDPDWRQFWIGT
jgi:hypothetical protein